MNSYNESKLKPLIILVIMFIFCSFNSNTVNTDNFYAQKFNLEKDLLLVHFDCKTDVDDLHSVAALASLLSDNSFSKVKYHAVAGTYGVQKGLYVPPNDLFQLAFNENWSDAHANFNTAIERVKAIAIATLTKEGDIWIADAGQSDFTAELLRSIQTDLPQLDLTQRIHVVQHSDWNEDVTAEEKLEFVKKEADYNKIADGNTVGNETPGFRDPEFTHWNDKISNPKLKEIWKLATDISNQYNGKDGRYNNEAIAAGGLDFSDLSEVCWIMGIQDIKDTEHFFNLYLN